MSAHAYGLWLHCGFKCRDVSFGMAVASTNPAKRRAIETGGGIDISHADICLNTSCFLVRVGIELIKRIQPLKLTY